MDNQIDQHKIIESYFPKERDWWIDLDWDDNDPTQPEATFKQEFDKWGSRVVKDGEYSDALRRLQNIQGKRCDQAFKELIWHVHAVSFFATPLNSKIKLKLKETLLKNKDYLQNIKSQVATLEKLSGLIKELKGTPYQQHSFFIKRSQFFDIDDYPEEGLKLFWPYPERDQFSIPFALFNKATETYLKQLTDDIPEKPSEDWLGEIGARKKYGALIYPNNLTPQAQRNPPEINSLLFNLVFLFRQFTSEHPDEDWFKITRGLMPEFGNSYYEYVAQISNAVFAASGIDTDNNYNFTEKNVMERVVNLTDQGVQLGSWVGIGF
jgi:hypothetical protein